MKANKYIAGILALLALQSASADTFHITGASAFRRATIDAVHALFTAGGDFKFVHNKGTDYQSADFITFEGTVTGLGATTIRCSFNGSIEGLRALAEPGTTAPDNNGNAYYIKPTNAAFVAATATASGTNVAITIGTDPTVDANMTRGTADMAFSDTDVAISPFADAPLETLGSVGAVAFAVCSSEGSGITNVTTQQYNSLLSNGKVPKSFFTGVASDTSLVFCTGRNDGSGTRSSYLSEMGFGVSNPVQQYLVIRGGVAPSTNENLAIQLVPAGGTNDTNSGLAGVQLNPASDIGIYHSTNPVTQNFTSASTAWDQDVPGNGGAFSGSAITGPLGRLGTSVRVFDASGANLYGGTPQTNVSLVSWISGNDAITARNAGAIICSFNGVSLSIAGGGSALTAADKEKITSGNYSAWNFQQFYRLSAASPGAITLYESLHASISSGILGAAGIAGTEFTVGRTGDGGTINPFE